MDKDEVSGLQLEWGDVRSQLQDSMVVVGGDVVVGNEAVILYNTDPVGNGDNGWVIDNVGKSGNVGGGGRGRCVSDPEVEWGEPCGRVLAGVEGKGNRIEKKVPVGLSVGEEADVRGEHGVNSFSNPLWTGIVSS